MVLEGGSIAVDGAGLLVTTERCLLNPNRNPTMTPRRDRARRSREHLGVDRIVWLADAIAEDDGTDGHVDNVVAFTAPGTALLQGCDDRVESESRDRASTTAGGSTQAGIEVIEIPVLPYARVGSEPVAPGPLREPLRAERRGARADERRRRRRRRCSRSSATQYPGREVVAVPGAVLAHGGGGVHCITQQVPGA